MRMPNLRFIERHRAPDTVPHTGDFLFTGEEDGHTALPFSHGKDQFPSNLYTTKYMKSGKAK